MTKDATQRSPSALLRAVSMSNGRWTFYEAVKKWVATFHSYFFNKVVEFREGSQSA
jgi:hypothetical protein